MRDNKHCYNDKSFIKNNLDLVLNINNLAACMGSFDCETVSSKTYCIKKFKWVFFKGI